MNCMTSPTTKWWCRKLRGMDMALFGALGTFAFGDVADEGPGIFSQVRPATIDTPSQKGVSNNYALFVPDGMVLAAATDEVATIMRDHAGNPDPTAAESEIASR